LKEEHFPKERLGSSAHGGQKIFRGGDQPVAARIGG
jgi:hypothetical protein